MSLKKKKIVKCLVKEGYESKKSKCYAEIKFMKHDYKENNQIKNVLSIGTGDYEQELFNKINHYMKILNQNFNLQLSKDFKEKCIEIYKDIINSIPQVGDKTKFHSFYNGLKRGKSPKYTAAGIIYYCLFKKGYKISKSELSKLLQLERSSLGHNLTSLFEHLKIIPNYEFIYETRLSRAYSEKEYQNLLEKFINQYTDHLATYLTDIKFLENDKEKIFYIFTKSIDSIQAKNKYEIFYERLIEKHPKMLASALCLLHIKYNKDYDLDGTHYIEILNIQKNVKLNVGDFRHSYRQFYSEFYSSNEFTYRNKVIKYLKKYIQILKIWINQNIRENDIKSSYMEELNEDFLKDAMYIFDSAINKGFQINLFSQNKISYFFPQTMALSLLFFNLKSIKKIEILASAEKFREYFQSEKSINWASLRFGTISSKINNHLYPFIKNIIGRYSGQVYSRESFIKLLKESLKNKYHIETEFLLKLFLLTSQYMSPNEFAENLGLYNGELKNLIRYFVKTSTSFRDANTFKRIKVFIKDFNNIPIIKNQKNAYSLINEIQKIRFRDFTHRGVKYAFRWIEERVDNITDTKLKNCLIQYLRGIQEENFPLEIFNDPYNLRASDLQFIGTRMKPVKTELIEKFFKNIFLKNISGKYDLCTNVRRFFNTYNIHKIKINPDHPPILSGILMNSPYAIAIEIPIWKNIKNSNKNFTGHIDLILHKENSLIVADYKQDQAEILKAIPQITAYSIMLKERLERIGYNKRLNLKCVGFSKKVAL